jgi:hypothetical protein
MNRVAAALLCGFFSVAVSRAEFDLRRVPTAQDVQTIRQKGWSAAADDLDAKLAGAWRPTHSSQAGSSGNALFRQWQRLYQWCRLLGTPEPEFLRAWLGRRVLQNPEQENALLIVPPGMALPHCKP